MAAFFQGRGAAILHQLACPANDGKAYFVLWIASQIEQLRDVNGPNIIRIPTKKVAKALEVDERTVLRWKKYLEDHQIITKVAGQSSYRVNSSLISKGNIDKT